MEKLFYGTKKIIGGEFEFNSFSKVPNNSKDKLTKQHTGTWTTNGRSALYLILKHFKEKGVKHVHLPAYLCQSIIQPILELKLDYSFYPIQADLTALPDPPRNSAVILIHYFGFINNSTSKLRMDSGQNFFLIEDACHVFLNDDYLNESKNQSLFFSTRKHNPTVLGGWCNLELDLDDPSKDIEVDALKSLAARVMKGMYLSDNEYEVNSTIEDYYLAWIIQEPKLTLECAEVLPEYFSRPENREIIVQLHKVGSKNYAAYGATWLRESLQPELIVQLESLLGKSLPQLDRKNVILAINNTILRLEERYLRELKAEEAIRFLEIGNEPLPVNNADSTLSTNKKIRENELLRTSLRQSIFKGK